MYFKNVRLVFNEFVPSEHTKGNFYCKPSKYYPYITHVSYEYYSVLLSIYGRFPLRLNPIFLRIEDLDGKLISTDLLLDNYNTNILAEIIFNHQGNCRVKMKKIGVNQVEIPVISDGKLEIQVGHETQIGI